MFVREYRPAPRGIFYFKRFYFLFTFQVAKRCHRKTTLLSVGPRSTAAAAGQLHRGNDDSAGLVHVDDGHQFLGAGLTTCHLDLQNKQREVEESGIVTRFNIQSEETVQIDRTKAKFSLLKTINEIIDIYLKFNREKSSVLHANKFKKMNESDQY